MCLFSNFEYINKERFILETAKNQEWKLEIELNTMQNNEIVFIKSYVYRI